MNLAYDAEIACRYFLDDLPGARQTGARLHGVLLKIEAGEPLSRLSQDFIRTNGYASLDAWINKQIDWDTFQKRAASERIDRIGLAEAKAAEDAATLAEQIAERNKAVAAHFAAIANDPKIRRQREAKELRSRFGIGYVDREYYQRIMGLLRGLSKGQRLNAEDVAWLQTEVDHCWTPELQKAWHVNEAEALSNSWRASSDPWDAINASSHWRKAGEPNKALVLTGAVRAQKNSNPKVRSALATTTGGALRDLNRLNEAREAGLEAHLLSPTDYRPCTLLGAVHIQTGDIVAGHEWYAKAEKLGADRRAVDQDIRALLARASISEQQRIRNYLTAQDPDRFAWLRSR